MASKRALSSNAVLHNSIHDYGLKPLATSHLETWLASSSLCLRVTPCRNTFHSYSSASASSLDTILAACYFLSKAIFSILNCHTWSYHFPTKPETTLGEPSNCMPCDCAVGVKGSRVTPEDQPCQKLYLVEL